MARLSDKLSDVRARAAAMPAKEAEPVEAELDGADALVVARVDDAYDAKDISVLKGLEAVRRRPGMYIGDTGVNGLHHLFKEIIDNAMDEVLAGHCTKIHVVYNADQSLSVEDNGRGIPVEVHEETGKSVVELVFTELHAGGRYGYGDLYKLSGGLHGVGAACVNALSAWLECEVRQDATIHRQRFERGIPTGPLAVVGTCGADEHGTKITYFADTTMFDRALDASGNLDYTPDRLRLRIRELAYLNKEVAISFHDARNNGALETYRYPRGIAEYVAHLNEGKETVHADVIYISGEQGDTQVEVALQYQKGEGEAIHCYVNNIYNQDGGTHLTGFKDALKRVINQYARQNGFLQDDDANSTINAVRKGLTAVVYVRLPIPKFYSATKDRLDNIEVEGIISKIVGKGLSEYLEENPEVARAILYKVASATAGKWPPNPQ